MKNITYFSPTTESKNNKEHCPPHLILWIFTDLIADNPEYNNLIDEILILLLLLILLFIRINFKVKLINHAIKNWYIITLNLLRGD